MPKVFGAQEVCNILGVSKATLIRWEITGKIPIPSRTPDNHRVYTLEDVAVILTSLNHKQIRKAIRALDELTAEVAEQLDTLEQLLKQFREALNS